jgi:hypothetical protein
MKRISVLTILMVSTAAFAIEGRAVYLVLITGALSMLLLSFLKVGRLLAARNILRTAPRIDGH